MLTISTPSPNDSMLENAETSSSTSRYAIFENYNTLSVIFNAHYYSLYIRTQSETDENDKSVEHVKDMTLASMVGLSPTENHEITRTSTGFGDMTLASMVDQNVDSLHKTDVFLMPEDENLVDMDIVTNETNENYIEDLNIKECQNSETIDPEPEEQQIYVKDMTLASVIGPSPSPSKNHEVICTSMDFRDMTLASMVDNSIDPLYKTDAFLMQEEESLVDMDIVTNENFNAEDLNMKEYQKLNMIENPETSSSTLRYANFLFDIENFNTPTDIFTCAIY